MKIQTLEVRPVDGIDYHNPKLAAAHAVIYSAANAITGNLRTVAATLATVQDDKLYADDGYKSCADWAQARLGIAQSTTSGMVAAGRVYNRYDNELAKVPGQVALTAEGEVGTVTEEDAIVDLDNSVIGVLNAMPASNLAVVGPMADTDELKDAINDGTISATTTQADLKKWKAAIKAEKAKPKQEFSHRYITGIDECRDVTELALALFCERNNPTLASQSAQTAEDVKIALELLADYAKLHRAMTDLSNELVANTVMIGQAQEFIDSYLEDSNIGALVKAGDKGSYDLILSTELVTVKGYIWTIKDKSTYNNLQYLASAAIRKHPNFKPLAPGEATAMVTELLSQNGGETNAD